MSDCSSANIERQTTGKALVEAAAGQAQDGRSALVFTGLARPRRGFTYIELVTALLLVGVLSAIATKALVRSKSRAFAAVVESDLRNLAVAQEDYFAERSTYFGGGGSVQLASSPVLGFAASPGVTFELRGGEAGWAGRAVHEKLVDRGFTCAFYTGEVDPYPPAVQEGVVTCRPAQTGSETGQTGRKDKKGKKDKGNNGNGNGNNGNNGNGNNGNGGKNGDNGKGNNGTGNGKNG
jgi:prepilin-type N-terminal cleavage/methylation domain-containing protein